MNEPSQQVRSKNRGASRLDASKTRGLAVGHMSEQALWSKLLVELGKALDHGERWEGRQAFYAAARARACAGELYMRGTQGCLFPEELDGGDPNAFKRAHFDY